MSKEVSNELLKVMNDIAENQSTIAKIDASIFLKESNRIINERIAYLFSALKIEAKNYNQSQDKFFEKINSIINNYKKHLNIVYDELYCQYINIQNELQEANNSKRIIMINFQKLINQVEHTNVQNMDIEQKEKLKKNNEVYNKIIEMCKAEFEKSRINFENIINEKFSITSNSLKLISEQTALQRFLGKITNIFNGKKKFAEILKEYEKIVNELESNFIIEQIRNETVEFVKSILNYKIKNEIVD